MTPKVFRDGGDDFFDHMAGVVERDSRVQKFDFDASSLEFWCGNVYVNVDTLDKKSRDLDFVCRFSLLDGDRNVVGKGKGKDVLSSQPAQPANKKKQNYTATGMIYYMCKFRLNKDCY